MDKAETLMEVENLRVSFAMGGKTVQAVRGASFRIRAGKTLALVGESGCGKSVTAKALMGLIEKPGEIQKESRILWHGRDIASYTQKEWDLFRGKECAMVFQDAIAALNPTLSIGKQLTEVLENHFPGIKRRERAARAENMIREAGIPDEKLCMKKYPHELSGGMRQRVMIAMAMLAKPKLLIADEPTTSLDVTVQAQILQLMKRLQREEHTAILMITHNMGIVAELADEVDVMYAGKIVEKGSAEDIFYHAAHPYTKALLASVPGRGNGKEKTRLTAIEGSVPDMISLPAGCGFCTRCPYADRDCMLYEPQKTELSQGHEVYCRQVREKDR